MHMHKRQEQTQRNTTKQVDKEGEYLHRNIHRNGTATETVGVPPTRDRTGRDDCTVRVLLG